MKFFKAKSLMQENFCCPIETKLIQKYFLKIVSYGNLLFLFETLQLLLLFYKSAIALLKGREIAFQVLNLLVK